MDETDQAPEAPQAPQAPDGASILGANLIDLAGNPRYMAQHKGIGPFVDNTKWQKPASEVGMRETDIKDYVGKSASFYDQKMQEQFPDLAPEDRQKRVKAFSDTLTNHVREYAIEKYAQGVNEAQATGDSTYIRNANAASMVPFVGTATDYAESSKREQAQKKIAAGEGEPYDFFTEGLNRARDRTYANMPWYGKVASGTGHFAKFGAELATGAAAGVPGLGEAPAGTGLLQGALRTGADMTALQAPGTIAGAFAGGANPVDTAEQLGKEFVNNTAFAGLAGIGKAREGVKGAFIGALKLMAAGEGAQDLTSGFGYLGQPGSLLRTLQAKTPEERNQALSDFFTSNAGPALLFEGVKHAVMSGGNGKAETVLKQALNAEQAKTEPASSASNAPGTPISTPEAPKATQEPVNTSTGQAQLPEGNPEARQAGIVKYGEEGGPDATLYPAQEPDPNTMPYEDLINHINNHQGMRDANAADGKLRGDKPEAVRRALSEYLQSPPDSLRADLEKQGASVQGSTGTTEAPPPGAVPEAAGDQLKNPDPLANAWVDEQRQKLGLEPLMGAARRTNQEVWDQAMQKIAADPKLPDRLVDELFKNPRATTVDENAILLHQSVRLRTSRDLAVKEVVGAIDRGADKETLDQLQKPVDDLLAQIDKLDKVSRATGTEWGRAGQFRRQIAHDDFTLGGMLGRMVASKRAPLTPEQTADIAKLQARIRDFEGQLAKAGPSFELSEKSRADLNNAYGEFLDKVEEVAAKDPAQRVLPWYLKLRRAMVLSWPTTFEKLTGAAALRAPQMSAEEAVGGVLSKVPGISKLAAVADIEGGVNTEAEKRAWTRGIIEGFKDSISTVKTGRSGLEQAVAPREQQRSVLDLPGELHGAFKAPVKRMAFERAYQKQMDSFIAKGQDPTLPENQEKIVSRAYAEGQRAIFMENNAVADGINNFTNSLMAKGGAAKALGVGIKIALPIVKIPTNIVAQTFEHVTGLATGSVQLGQALRKGMENVSPDEANLIMRHLKKGAVGAAMLTLGYLRPDMFGGYYQPGEKRKDDDAKFGSMKIFGMNVPSLLLHNPLMEAAQFGATIRRVGDKYRKGEQQGVGAGTVAAAAGLLEEVPMVREQMEVSKMIDPQTRGRAMGDFAKGLVVPGAVQWLSGRMDQKPGTGNFFTGEEQKRKASGVGQAIQSGVPIWRQSLPARR